MATAVLSVPIKLLHEGEGHTITVELKSGEQYRGTLTDAEDTMNISLSSCTHTARDGRVSKLEQVYIRGSHVRLIVLPDLLKNAPVFKRVHKAKKTADKRKKAKSAGRGKA